jgi:N-acetylneuraminic acid mutarotase
MIVFGGVRDSYAQVFDDVWRYDLVGRTWTQLASAQAPTPRDAFTAVYDGQGRMLVFGGKVNNTDTVFNDLWAYDIASQTWARVASAEGPPPRFMHSAVNEGGADMIVFGGFAGGAGGGLNDVWDLDSVAGVWTQLPSSSGPSPRASASAIADASGRMIVFGGTDGGGALGDVWSYSLR